MKLSQFKYFLPQDLIAIYPHEERNEARLIVLNRAKKTIEHKKFKDIIDYFDDGDVFVTNNTKVFPAMLQGEKEKTKASINVFLLRELDKESRLWDVLVDPARKIRIGNKIYFDNGSLIAEVIDNTTSRGRTLRFLFDGSYEEFKRKLFSIGQMPIPESIQKLRDVSEQDADYYQTIYAKNEGAVVAPAAGLHLSREMIKMLELKGVSVSEITLHAGIGNFKTIDVEDLAKHKMDSEEMEIMESSATIINEAKSKGKKICAVGTTCLKALESSVYISGLIKPYKGWTNKFIFPPYDFKSANVMITNLHPSQSSMLMLVCAFGGFDLVMKAYKEAINEKYRFLTYGDAMLII
ncbi:MAG: tRNA preQ1(34) S-adenosylmethionine ribosyltransferase-isomerase QueA [Bacteroidales bacterium]|nr:tRNA preQ1(34) S-adenosylmethionine ribosyltransferase-isomerase QueA [Bacteroidales bacterium]MDD4209923.1 tRNA preQ1(34) S-adenosylmethionine ribosyltransferase-isomerase QueA [Bacteroidales bacterium]